MGHWALGMGHGAWGMGEDSLLCFLLPILFPVNSEQSTVNT